MTLKKRHGSIYQTPQIALDRANYSFCIFVEFGFTTNSYLSLCLLPVPHKKQVLRQCKHMKIEEKIHRKILTFFLLQQICDAFFFGTEIKREYLLIQSFS